MSRTLLGMVHDKATASYTGPEINKDNYVLWVKHWFACAEELYKSFVDEGLVDTAAAMRAHIEQQKGFCKKYLE